MSMQKFCGTIFEAANVMVASLQDADNIDGAGNNNVVVEGGPSDTSTEHGASLAKAVRGFINKTLREMEEHDAFRDYLHPNEKGGDNENIDAGDDDAAAVVAANKKEQLLASLEKFVYAKCRGDIDMVLSAGKVDEATSTSKEKKTVKEMESELQNKMQSLQFVTPAHLEIECLKSTSSQGEDIDLSYSIRKLRSIGTQYSPRQILQSILAAHRGVTAALKNACHVGESNANPRPPGADDVLPTLILATLRAHPPHLPTTLRFVEQFAPPPLLKGEAGYAYTNLCGALQFIRELDVDGHLAEVTLGGKGEVLAIGPEEFKAGLEGCRRRMKEQEEERLRRQDGGDGDGYIDDMNAYEECCAENTTTQLNVKITARQVREARSHGETVDLDWAMQRQNESLWEEGRVASIAQPRGKEEARQQPEGNIPPEEPPLPSHFSRSYSFLTTRPENVGIRDLPKLLKEYKMLVQATEKLLNERTVWRENECKRQLKLEREQLEREFVNVIGVEDESYGDMMANGH